MNLYLIRHGESQSNYDNKYNRAYYCGQLDVPLTEKGVESAKQLKPYFYNIKINDVYVSDLTRTKETYQYIFPYDIPTTVTSLLRERSLGLFEGQFKDKLMKSNMYHRYFHDPNYKDFRHSFIQKAPEGESYNDVYYRVKQFFETIHIQDDHTIVIIAHQVVIRCIMVYFGYINKEEALIKVIENCKPYLIEL